VLASLDDLVFGIDAEGRFIDYHAPSVGALYVPPSAFLGRPHAEVLPPEVSDQLRTTIAAVAATGRPGQFDYRLDIAGEPRWWSVKVSSRNSGGTPAYTVVSREVTERTLAAAALQEREAELLAIVDMAPIGIAQADSITRRLVRVNERMCAITGYSTEELLGRNLGDITHPEDRERDRALFEGLVRGDWPEYRTEKRYLRKDGGIAWVRINATMLRDAAGRPIRTLATVEDLSAQRATEEQLRVAQKMEAVGRLAGGVAHDFNNLLTVILSYTEFARDDLPPEAPLRADLLEVEQAARRAEALTRQLLAFGRRQPQRAEPLVVGELVQDVSKLLRRLIGEDIELVVSAGPEAAEIFADRGQMEQVLMNLAVNARDAMPDGGRVTIRSAAVELDGALASQIGAGPHVEISVSDTGHGMDAATREHIFEPFFTTKPVGKGTGLGLSTVYGIVKQSGGCVVVESAPGQGATFRAYLPQRARERVSAPSLGASTAAGGNETLLLVEDEDALRRAACRILGSAGYEVLCAANAAEALTIAAERGAEIRLIITDVVMPGMNGKELADALRGRCPSAPVLFTSGYTDDAIARHGVLGPHFLPKPYARPQLTTMVRQLLDSR
jgi:PAS domain S-box-containing protein